MRILSFIICCGFVMASSMAHAEDLHAKQTLSKSRVVLRTNFGDMVLALYPKVAPEHVKRILKMAEQGHLNGMMFGRLERNFVLQMNPLALPPEMKNEYPPLKAEFSNLPHVFGVLSMARQDGDINSATTSFSIMLGKASHLDEKYTVFGRVENGLDVLTAIQNNVAGESKIPKHPVVIQMAEVYDIQSDGGTENFQLKPVTVPAEAVRAIPTSSEESSRSFESMSLWLLILGQVLLLLQYVRRIKPETKKYLRGLMGLVFSLGVFGICFELPEGPLNMTAKFLGFLGLILTLRALSGIESSTRGAFNPEE